MKKNQALLWLAILLLSVWGVVAQDVNLDATYTTADELLTFDHPSKWIFYDGDDAGVAYTDDDESDVTIEIEWYDDLNYDDMMAVATEFGDPIEISEMVLDDRNVTLVIMSVFRGQRDYRYIVEVGDDAFVSLWFIDGNGVYEDVQDTLEAVVASINNEDESDRTEDSGVQTFSFGSADDWEYDMIVSSYAKSFTITIPSSLFDFSASERTPDNITLTNNWDIFQDDGGITFNDGDILLIYDYYETAVKLDLSSDATLEDVTDAVVSRSQLTYSEPNLITLSDYDGYVFVATGPGTLISGGGVFDVGDGAFVSFYLITTNFEDASRISKVAYQIVESFEKGLSFDRVGAVDLELPETYTRDDGFTMPYPEGWAIDVNTVGESEFVTVTKGQVFDLSNPPIEGEPVAIVAYGTMTELTGMPMTMLNPDTNAMRVIQNIIGASPDEIVELEIKGYKAAQVVSVSDIFENWFIAIMLDDNHFIATNLFTAVEADTDFFGTVTEMMIQARFGDLEPIAIGYSASDDTADDSEPDDSESTDTDTPADSLSTIELPETFLAESNGLTFNYPSGWIAYDVSDEVSAIINTQAAFDALTQQLPPASGQVLITIFTHVGMDAMGGGDNDIRLMILNSTVFTEDVDELKEAQINDRTIYTAEGSLDDADKIVILVQTGDHFEFISALTAPDEMDDFRDTIIAIALSMAVES